MMGKWALLRYVWSSLGGNGAGHRGPFSDDASVIPALFADESSRWRVSPHLAWFPGFVSAQFAKQQASGGRVISPPTGFRLAWTCKLRFTLPCGHRPGSAIELRSGVPRIETTTLKIDAVCPLVVPSRREFPYTVGNAAELPTSNNRD